MTDTLQFEICLKQLLPVAAILAETSLHQNLQTILRSSRSSRDSEESACQSRNISRVVLSSTGFFSQRGKGTWLKKQRVHSEIPHIRWLAHALTSSFDFNDPRIPIQPMYASDFVLFVLEAADSEKYIFAIWLASELTAVLATAPLCRELCSKLRRTSYRQFS